MTDVSLTSLRHRDVLDVASATVIGRVDDVVIDLLRGQVAALIVGKGTKDSPVLPWDRVVAVGPDAVTVDGTDAVRPSDGPRERDAAAGDLDPVGKPVLTTEGDAVGRFDDVVFDTETGALTDLVIDGRTVPASDLVGIGGFAAIVRPAR